MSHRLYSGVLKHVLLALMYGSIGVLLTAVVVFVMYMNGRPELDAWHTVDLEEEFTADAGLTDFSQYLELEDRLFDELDKRVYALSAAAKKNSIDRFQRGSLADPERWSPNWNRSFLMESQAPRSAVLLLHGLSDAPYSLRQMALRLHSEGATVLGLRVPGHGTAPSGLVTVRWQDMAAAVELAVGHLARIAPGVPIHIVGYSNGAALAVHYALSSLDDSGLPRVGRLLLISPEIAVAPAAALAAWQARLGHLLGLDKLAWNEILLEYEPFKYGSFAVNAADVSHRITAEIQRLIEEAEADGRIGALPPILAFSSVVDATVRAPALVRDLFNRLSAGGHELVLFDLNRQASVEDILRWNADEIIAALREGERSSYALTLVTNENPRSRDVVEQHWDEGEDQSTRKPLDMSWPTDVYSLSHVALPFPPDDPIYGDHPRDASPGIRLGGIALRGEKGALLISSSTQLRLRWNPFYTYLEDRSVAFLGLAEPAAAGPETSGNFPTNARVAAQMPARFRNR